MHDMQNVKWWLHNIFFKRTISLMVTCHVIYAQNIHQKLISTAQILTNNFQNTFAKKHSNIGYSNIGFCKGTQILTNNFQNTFCQKSIQILDIAREHTYFDKQPLKHSLPNKPFGRSGRVTHVIIITIYDACQKWGWTDERTESWILGVGLCRLG